MKSGERGTNSFMVNAHIIGNRKTPHYHALQAFLVGDPWTHSDEALLELLLTYVKPPQEALSLAKNLLTTFGDLLQVLTTDGETLCTIDGIDASTVALLKLVGYIRTYQSPQMLHQMALLDNPKHASTPSIALDTPRQKRPSSRRKSEIFSAALLEETVEILPKLPATQSLQEIKEFLWENLPFNAQQTRRTCAWYIAHRMFPEGLVDPALCLFARKYAGRQELRNVCLYRFFQAEPLMFRVAEDLLLPALGTGRLERDRLDKYLVEHASLSQNIKNCALAVVKTFVAGGIAQTEKRTLTFAYQDILLPAFAFVLHSEFPVPGMYRIAALESNIAIRSLLWNPDRLLPSLYELRNRGIISKVSEIDDVRQFTTKWTLDQMVNELESTGRKA